MTRTLLRLWLSWILRTSCFGRNLKNRLILYKNAKGSYWNPKRDWRSWSSFKKSIGIMVEYKPWGLPRWISSGIWTKISNKNCCKLRGITSKIFQERGRRTFSFKINCNVLKSMKTPLIIWKSSSRTSVVIVSDIHSWRSRSGDCLDLLSRSKALFDNWRIN